MFNKIKIPLLATFIIIAMFILQATHIIRLVSKDLENKDIVELVSFSKEIERDFESIKFKSTLVYQYAVLDSKGRVLTTNLHDTPSNFDFQILKQNGYIYYKNFFFYEDELLYLVVSKKINYEELIFITFLMLVSSIIVICLAMYFMYLSITNSYLEQRKMLDIFFNDAMHELKTPLGVASINLEMLDVKNKHTHRIKSALKQMKVTYEDVEYYIKNNQVNFPKKILNISEFLQNRIRFLSTIAHSKNIEIISDIEENLFVFFTEIEATRLIDNNISNAIKYSKVDSKIYVFLKKEDDYIVLIVKDFGQGIKDIKNIWNRYTREDVSQGGFGLGLNIVLNICLEYDISYNVESVYGEGSEFSYKIPVYVNKLLDNII